MTFNEKIILLNDAAEGTLSITFYNVWEITSYGINTLFRCDGPIGIVHARSLVKCVDKAILAMNNEINV